MGYASTPATIASLASLGIFLIPLIALLLAYDAIVGGEEEGGTLLLLMTYPPLSKSQLLLGKFLGHGLTLALATIIGFGVAGIAIAVLVEDVAIAALAVAMGGRFVGSTVLLGWGGFIALAYLVSVRVSEKPVAAGLALAIWFFFVLIFDLMLLGTLVASEGKLNPELLPWLLMLNPPTDIYRLLNIVAFGDSGQLSGVLSWVQTCQSVRRASGWA